MPVKSRFLIPKNIWLALLPYLLLIPQFSLALEAQTLEKFVRSENYVRGLAGFAGHQFESDIIFEKILAEKDAAIFFQIIDSPAATPAAIAYSLCGLKKLGSKIPPKTKNKLENFDYEVSVMRGDIMKKESLLKIEKSILEYGC